MSDHEYQTNPWGHDRCNAKVDEDGRLRLCDRPAREHAKAKMAEDRVKELEELNARLSLDVEAGRIVERNLRVTIESLEHDREALRAANTRQREEVERLTTDLAKERETYDALKRIADAMGARNARLRESCNALDEGLSRVEAFCARTLAGDKEKRILIATLTLVIERTQEIRASLRKPCPDCGGPADHVHPKRAASDNSPFRQPLSPDPKAGCGKKHLGCHCALCRAALERPDPPASENPQGFRPPPDWRAVATALVKLVYTHVHGPKIVDEVDAILQTHATKAPSAPCLIPSSVSGAACLLDDGHPPDSPNRFHRYRQPDVEDTPCACGAVRNYWPKIASHETLDGTRHTKDGCERIGDRKANAEERDRG